MSDAPDWPDEPQEAMRQVDRIRLKDLGSYTNRHELRRYAVRNKPRHLRAMENHIDRLAQEGAFMQEFECYCNLIQWTLRQGDKYRRLLAYYTGLQDLQRRIEAAALPESAVERKAWLEMTGRLGRLLLQIDETVDHRKKVRAVRLTKERDESGQFTGASRLERPAQPAAAPKPSRGPDVSGLDDAALAALIPEEQR